MPLSNEKLPFPLQLPHLLSSAFVLPNQLLKLLPQKLVLALESPIDALLLSHLQPYLCKLLIPRLVLGHEMLKPGNFLVLLNNDAFDVLDEAPLFLDLVQFLFLELKLLDHLFFCGFWGVVGSVLFLGRMHFMALLTVSVIDSIYL